MFERKIPYSYINLNNSKIITMSNNPFLRNITNSLNGYWKDHPGQRDTVHGTYHLIEGNNGR
jgi:hypothetical protein